MMKFISTKDMTREQWLAERRKGIGGSDIAAVVGASPYQTAYDVWLEKTGRATDDIDSDVMYWGRVLEDLIAREYTLRTDNKVRRLNVILVHPDYPFARANIDRLVMEGNRIPFIYRTGKFQTSRMLECKTAGAHMSKQWGEPGTDQIPVHYAAQVQWYLGITGLTTCDVAVLIGGQKFQLYTLHRDDEVIRSLFTAAAKFWDLVESDTPPSPQNLKDVAALYPTDDGEPVTATGEILNKIEELQRLKNEAKEVSARIKMLELAIKEYMGDAPVLADSTGKKLCTWKIQTRRMFDAKKLKSELPDIYDKYAYTKDCRTFRM